MKRIFLFSIALLLSATYALATYQTEALVNKYLYVDKQDYVVKRLSELYSRLYSNEKWANTNMENFVNFNSGSGIFESTMKDSLKLEVFFIRQQIKSGSFSKNVMVSAIENYRKEASALPSFYTIIKKKFGGNAQAYADYVFDSSIFLSQEKYDKFANNVTCSLVSNDPFIVFLYSIYEYRDYFAIIKKIQTDKAQTDGENSFTTLLSASIDYMNIYREFQYDSKFGSYEFIALWKEISSKLNSYNAANKLVTTTISQYVEEHPFSTADRQALIENLKGNEQEADRIISSSILTNKKLLAKFLKHPSLKMLKEDSFLKLVEK